MRKLKVKEAWVICSAMIKDLHTSMKIIKTAITFLTRSCGFLDYLIYNRITDARAK